MLVNMAGQQQAGAASEHSRPLGAPPVDAALLDAAVEVIAVHGQTGLTLARLAERAGTSRMTLHRRGITVPGVVAGLAARAAVELRDALFPALTGTGPAAGRLRDALLATFVVADRHLPLLAALFADDTGVFHGQPDETGALPTADVFVAPFAKLLADGAADGSLRAVDDPSETAAVLFNAAGWGYVQLRHSQRWPPERAAAGILHLVLTGVTADLFDIEDDAPRV